MFVARNHHHSRAPTIEDALQLAIADVRSDDAPEDWVLSGFRGGDDIELIGIGTGGIEVSNHPRTMAWTCRELVGSWMPVDRAMVLVPLLLSVVMMMK